MPNLIDVAREVMSRTPEGKEVALASQAIKDWKKYPKLHEAYVSVVDYYDFLVEMNNRKANKSTGRGTK